MTLTISKALLWILVYGNNKMNIKLIKRLNLKIFIKYDEKYNKKVWDIKCINLT
jgi:hypothetical protein